MSIFITGADSFIGKHLREVCVSRGIDTFGVDSNPKDDQITTKADIRNPQLASLIPENSTVIHLAAISRDNDCRSDTALAFDINVNGTLNVLTAAIKRNARQVIFASSEWVYGDVDNNGIQREDDPIDITRMKSEYAITKVVGEQLLRLGRGEIDVTVLRFGIVYAPRLTNWSAVENLCNAARFQDEIQIGSAQTSRRFIHVQDVVTGILSAVGQQGFNIFNLSGDRKVSLGEIIQLSSKIWNRDVKVLESNPSYPSIRNPDNSKIKAALNWHPKYEIYDGLVQCVELLKSNG